MAFDFTNKVDPKASRAIYLQHFGYDSRTNPRQELEARRYVALWKKNFASIITLAEPQSA